MILKIFFVPNIGFFRSFLHQNRDLRQALLSFEKWCNLLSILCHPPPVINWHVFAWRRKSGLCSAAIYHFWSCNWHFPNYLFTECMKSILDEWMDGILVTSSSFGSYIMVLVARHFWSICSRGLRIRAIQRFYNQPRTAHVQQQASTDYVAETFTVLCSKIRELWPNVVAPAYF